MSIRIPLKAIVTSDNSTELGAGSVAGGVAIPFVIPQDTDNVVVKFAASMVGTGVSATFQTTDDGGTTWYDVARTSIVSNTPAGFEQWLSVSTIEPGTRSASVVATGSIVAGGAIGAAAASTLSQGTVSGMPILSQYARVFLIINGNITSAASNSLITTVKVNSQSATA